MAQDTDKDLRRVKALVKLVTENRLDLLEVGDVKIVKTRHTAPLVNAHPELNGTSSKEKVDQREQEDNILFGFETGVKYG